MKTSRKPTRHYILSLLTLFIVPIYIVCQQFGENAKKFWKMENFGVFVVFNVNLRHCHSENFNKFFAKTYWALHFFLVDPFHCSNLKVCQKFGKKIIENWKILGFLLFLVSIWDIFILKKSINSSKTTPRKPIFLRWHP